MGVYMSDEITKAFKRAEIRAGLGFPSALDDLQRDLDAVIKPRFIPLSGRPCVTNPATLLRTEEDI